MHTWVDWGCFEVAHMGSFGSKNKVAPLTTERHARESAPAAVPASVLRVGDIPTVKKFKQLRFSVGTQLSPASKKMGARHSTGGIMRAASLPVPFNAAEFTAVDLEASAEAGAGAGAGAGTGTVEAESEERPVSDIVKETRAALLEVTAQIKASLAMPQEHRVFRRGELEFVSPMYFKSGQLHGVNIRVSTKVEEFDLGETGNVATVPVALQFCNQSPFTGAMPDRSKINSQPKVEAREALDRKACNMSMIHLPNGSVVGIPDGSMEFLAQLGAMPTKVPNDATFKFMPATGLQVYVYNAPRNVEAVCLLSFCFRPVQSKKLLVGGAGAGGPGRGFATEDAVVFDNGLRGTPPGTRLLFWLNGDAVFGLLGPFTSVFVEVDPVCMRVLSTSIRSVAQICRGMMWGFDAIRHIPPRSLEEALTAGVLEGRAAMSALAGGLRGFGHVRVKPLRFVGNWRHVVAKVPRYEIVRALCSTVFLPRDDGDGLEVFHTNPLRGVSDLKPELPTGAFTIDPRFVLAIEDFNHETLMSLLPVNGPDSEACTRLLTGWEDLGRPGFAVERQVLADVANAPMTTRLLPPVLSAACALITIECSPEAISEFNRSMLPKYLVFVKQLAELTQKGVLNNRLPPGYNSYLSSEQVCLAEMALMCPGPSSVIQLPGLSPRFLSLECVRELAVKEWFKRVDFLPDGSDRGRTPSGTYFTFFIIPMLQNVMSFSKVMNLPVFNSAWGTRDRHYAYTTDPDPPRYHIVDDAFLVRNLGDLNKEWKLHTEKALLREATEGMGVTPRSRAPEWWNHVLRVQDQLDYVDNPSLESHSVERTRVIEFDGVDTSQAELLFTPRNLDAVSAILDTHFPLMKSEAPVLKRR